MDNYMKIVINAVKQWVTDKFSSWDLAIDNKVDKIEGKGLSTEDYTTEEKEKLASLNLETILPEVTEENNGEVLSVVDGKWDIKNIPQADWNQNDATAADYIKNRTHWIDSTQRTLIASAEDCEFYDGYSEPTIDITSYGRGLIIGEPYYVMWDGVEYPNLIAFDDDGYPTLGAFEYDIGNEYPFSIYTYEEDGTIYLGAADNGANEESYHSFSVYENNLIYHQLDEKFIPDSIARIDEIPEQKQTDWNQTDETAVDYIKNKPFYITQEAQYKPIFENWTIDVNVAENGLLTCEWLVPDYEDDLLIQGAKYKIIFQCDDNIYEHVSVAQDVSFILPSFSGQGEQKVLGLSNNNWNQNDMINFTSGYYFMANYEIKNNAEYIIFPNGIGQFMLRENGFNKNQITISLYQIISEEKKISQRYTHHADWNQNVYGADGYVQNRPLYLAENAQTLIFDQDITFVPGEQFSPVPYYLMLDFNKETDRILGVWDGVPYLCSPYYAKIAGEYNGWYDLYDLFTLGYIYTANQLEDFPFHIEAFRPTTIAAEYGGLNAIALIGIKQIPTDKVEIHNLKLYKVGKNWQFDNGLNYALQADWEENSNDAHSFIKNRPMYKTIGTTKTTVLTLENLAYNDGAEVTAAIMPIDPINLAYNETYQVKLYTENNEVLSYDTKVQYLGMKELFYLGNLSLLSPSIGADTKEPFILVFASWNGQNMVIVSGIEEYEKIEIEGYEVIYSTLDIKYLPEIVQTMVQDYSNISKNSATQSDWNQTDETAVDYIKNKPDFNFSKISLRDQGNGQMYDILLYNGELIVKPSGTELVITTLPNKLSYNYDETFDPTGMIVSLTLTDGTLVEIENYTYEVGVGVGVVPVTIKTTYLEKIYTTTFEINITHVDFEFKNNNDGTVSVVSWNGTYNGEPSTYCVLPQPYDNFTFIA